METVPVLASLIPVFVFIFFAVQQSKDANTFTKFFMFGEEFRETAFLATIAASSTALGAVIIVFVLLGYLYGMGIWVWRST